MHWWRTISELLVAVCTLVLAAVAVFQETIRGWFYRPAFRVSIKTEPPDCVAVPFTSARTGTVTDSVYLRLWIQNVGNATAKNAEVYAKELRQLHLDGTWKRVDAFPPMNLMWSDVRVMYFPTIASKMGKHCDLGHIVDPAGRQDLHEDSPRLALTNQQTSLAFDLVRLPNHKGHIVGPGEYELDVLVAAENARPSKRTIKIRLSGTWYSDEARMLHAGVGVTVQ